MSKFFLLRHAEPIQSLLDDFNRCLTPNGIKKSKEIGKLLNDYEIEAIFSSDSLRTKQTVENLKDQLNYEPKIFYKHSLYNCNLDYLLQFIEDSLHQYNNFIIVNHNPAISNAAFQLAKQSIDSPLLDEVAKGFSPGSLALFENNKLVKFWR